MKYAWAAIIAFCKATHLRGGECGSMLPPRKKSWKSETLWDVTSSILGHNWRSFFSWTYLFYVFYRNSQKSSRCKMVCHPAGFRRLAAPNVDHVPLLSFLYVTGKAFTVMAILFTLDKILNDKVKGERRVNRSIPFKESSQPHSLRLWIYRICELSTILCVLDSLLSRVNCYWNRLSLSVSSSK